MKVVIAHNGPLSELIVASSVNIGVKKYPVQTQIIWIVPEEHKYIFRYNKNVKAIFSYKEFKENNNKYDLLINLWPKEVETKAMIKNFTGFEYCPFFDQYRQSVMGTYESIEMSNFQLYYFLAGMTWRGEGYDLSYYPRSKSKKNRIGMSAANANLRNYVIDNLDLGNKKIWYIPYKKNIFKKMEEINKCKKIITDDLLTMHLSLALRKYVYYLETYPHTYKIEMFGKGQVYPVPFSYLK
jgi:hypothetical protein